MRKGIFAAKKILLMRTDRIGDLLVATPAIRAVRKHFPDAQIDFLGSNLNADVLSTSPHINTAYTLQLQKIWTWPALLFHLRKQKYDLLLCFNGNSSKAVFFSRMIPAKAKYGISIPKHAGVFSKVFVPQEKQHRVFAHLNFLHFLGIAPDGEYMECPVPEPVRAATQKEFPRVAKVLRLGVFIGNAKKIHSRWPAEKFAQLVAQILDEGVNNRKLEVYLIAGQDEIPLLSHFHQQDGLHIYKGECGIIGTAAFLQTCDALLTSSSGPWHLAAAAGVPTIGIISQFSSEFWRPLNKGHIALTPEHSGKDIRDISVQTVHAAITQFFAEFTE